MAYARIIVDVPTMQTNHPYDYLIPDNLADQVAPGKRVVVSFGKGTRQVMGMVVGMRDQTDFDGEVKSVLRVLDDQPVISAELLALSKWLATDTFSFWISCLQTMLPNALKTESRRLNKQTDETEIVNKGRIQTREYVRATKTAADYAALTTETRKNAKNQIKLLKILTELVGKDAVALQTLSKQDKIPRATFTDAADKGWLAIEDHEYYRHPYAQLDDLPRTKPLHFTDEQQRAYDSVSQSVDQHLNDTYLLEGVTGSGKTEVYLQLIARTRQEGRDALMLVPEIGLTPQMVKRVKGRFGSEVAVLHSGLSDGERYDEWRRIARGEAHIVIGARSAAFAPLQNLGLIVMDEEHETSYKQDDTPRYHARDVLAWRAKYNHAPLLLGSATPSLESRARAEKGVYKRLLMPERTNNKPLPPVDIIDMREAEVDSYSGDISNALTTALQTTMARGEQAVLMLNRRGFSSFVMCRECGYVAKCPNCDISLTLHMDTHTLRCHYCGHEEAIPKICPSCKSRKIRYYGTGTEKVEQTLHQLFPDAGVLRMDVDTTRKKGAHGRILKAFGDGKADILLGTQMIAKGLDFPNVTLVGVINADTALGLPDFRASERTFQLLTQVSGRAGRADKPGRVLIQTFNPDNYAIQLAQRHDYERFFGLEMHMRHEGNYPPYYFTFKLTVSHEEEDKAAKAIFKLADQLTANLSDQAIILGPTRGAIARVKRRYYYQVVIKYKNEPNLQKTLADMLESTQMSSRSGYQIAFDREPLSFI
ncbi:primosomal protein N' [Lacticaseibacillus pabuli]|uniref:Replication restart protein PriA n=1 Tax=Lacticaseibacillus pabuli TaxID=3025672 RepID=A0ABY7WXI7_9LACO|nr:primosomal protein N' [Lacticaseibacillus sp. KACC 23028]WDF83677.1 primosomal protein N' [Lacticaseibacillus sp. KACC 23028]